MSARPASIRFQSTVETILRWDSDVVQAVRRFEAAALQKAMRALTRAGDTTGWLVHCAVVYALLRIDLHSIMVMILAAILATIASQVAKRIFRRSRPSAAIPGFQACHAIPDPYSFPSGHSTVAFAVATAAVATTPALGAMETVLAVAIGCSRVVLGAHYPVDVIGGMALGFCCGLAAWSLPF